MKRSAPPRRKKPWRPKRKAIMRASASSALRPTGTSSAARFYIRRSTKRIRQVNPEAEARRRARRRKWYASKEYKADRAAAFTRDGHRCTFVACLVNGPEFAIGASTKARRCDATTGLHYHETSYRNRKGVTVCETHHALVEATYYPHRKHR